MVVTVCTADNPSRSRRLTLEETFLVERCSVSVQLLCDFFQICDRTHNECGHAAGELRQRAHPVFVSGPELLELAPDTSHSALASDLAEAQAQACRACQSRHTRHGLGDAECGGELWQVEAASLSALAAGKAWPRTRTTLLHDLGQRRPLPAVPLMPHSKGFASTV